MAKEKLIYDGHLVQIDELSSTVRNFHFEFKDPPRFGFEPGQFVMVEVPRDGKTVRKPYSIASAPELPNKIELCIKKVEGGYVSSYFFDLKVGYVMPMEAPLGVFKMNPPYPEHLVFVATGTGVAPLRSMIHHLLHEGYQGKMTLILGVRYENEILFDAEFKDLTTKHSNFSYIVTISRPETWTGEKGYVQDQIKKHFSVPQGIEIYACGLVPMINSLKETLESLGYEKKALHFERWT